MGAIVEQEETGFHTKPLKLLCGTPLKRGGSASRIRTKLGTVPGSAADPAPKSDA